MRDVALEIPLGSLAFTGCREGDDPRHARVEALGDTLDRPTLTCGVPAFKQHQDLESFVLHPALQAHQFVL